jgi:hypothetical protein
MSYEDMKAFLADNPHIQPVYTMNIIGGTGDRVKVDAGMNDMLGRIARANPGSPLAEKYGDKGIRASKTREAVKRQQKKHNIDTSTS